MANAAACRWNQLARHVLVLAVPARRGPEEEVHHVQAVFLGDPEVDLAGADMCGFRAALR